MRSTSDSKMKELILYVATASADDAKFGAVKLNKLLFYSDFLSFLRRGKSITNQQYFAIAEGPAPRRLIPIRKEMERCRDISVRKINRFGFVQHRIEAMRPPDYTQLESEDVAIASSVIHELRDMSAKDVTRTSHKFAGWSVAFEQGGEGTEIPYESVRFDIEGFSAGMFGISAPEIERPQDYVTKLLKKLGES